MSQLINLKTYNKVKKFSRGLLPSLCQHSPVSVLIEDFSQIMDYFMRLKKKGTSELRTYFEKRPEEVLTLAKKVKVLDVNRAALDLYQAETKEQLYSGLHKVFSKESYVVFREELIALSEGKTEFQGETVNLTLTGEVRHIMLKLTVMPGFEDTLKRVVVHIMDISSMKRKESELSESEEKYRTIFETANEAIFVVDTETGIIVDANEKAGRLLGIHAHEIKGMHFTELHPPQEADLYRDLFRKHVRMGSLISGTCTLMQRSGRRIPVSISGSVMAMKGKNLISGIFRELTAAYEREEVPAAGFAAPKIQSGRDSSLTPREQEVVKLIASGLSSKEIAGKLYISLSTVKTHRARILQKLQLHKSTDMVKYAMASGLFNSKPRK